LHLLVGVLAVPNQCTAKPLNIGLIAPLTGPLQEHGHAIYEGLKLGVEQGGCTDRVSLIVEDDAYDPKKTVSAAQKILTRHQIDLLLNVGSGPARAITSMVEHRKIPLLSLAGDASVAIGNPHVIRLRKPGEEEGIDVAELALKEGATRVALLCSQNEFTLSVCNGIQRRLGTVVQSRQDVPPDTTDYRAEVLRIRSSNPSHILPIMVPGKLGIVARQIRDSGVSTPFIGGVFFESSGDLKIAQGALDGSKYVISDISSEFRKAYASLDSVAAGSIAWSAVFYDVGLILCRLPGRAEERLPFLRSFKELPGAAVIKSFTSKDGDQFFYSKFITAEIPYHHDKAR
jgi:branched-chain amino acid transport system substrate-binding protein